MMRVSHAAGMAMLLAGLSIGTARAAPDPHPAHAGAVHYAPTVQGKLVDSRLAGVEPDGDPLYQVVIRTKLAPSGGVPAANLIVSSYLENFKPDTTPILPDLLHPGKTATNLGGFLQGKALLTDDAGNILYIGSFVADAFLDNSNHAAMQLFGSSRAYGGEAVLRGAFTLKHNFQLTGYFRGSISMPPAARSQLIAHRGKAMRSIKHIISAVTVKPAPMVGRAGNSSGKPLHTGYGRSAGVSAPAAQPTQQPSRRLSPWTYVAAAGAILSLLMAALLYYIERRRAAPTAT